jgi:hypothetical protein
VPEKPEEAHSTEIIKTDNKGQPWWSARCLLDSCGWQIAGWDYNVVRQAATIHDLDGWDIDP